MNIYDFEIPTNGEVFDNLLEKGNLRIVRIVSSDQIEPELYIQEEDEWVVLIEGSATVEIDDKKIYLNKGDTLYISQNTPHKVLEASKGALWLAVHF